MRGRPIQHVSWALALALGLGAVGSGQELDFEELTFDFLHHADLRKEDLIEKVVVIHFWGAT